MVCAIIMNDFHNTAMCQISDMMQIFTVPFFSGMCLHYERLQQHSNVLELTHNLFNLQLKSNIVCTVYNLEHIYILIIGQGDIC